MNQPNVLFSYFGNIDLNEDNQTQMLLNFLFWQKAAQRTKEG